MLYNVTRSTHFFATAIVPPVGNRVLDHDAALGHVYEQKLFFHVAGLLKVNDDAHHPLIARVIAASGFQGCDLNLAAAARLAADPSRHKGHALARHKRFEVGETV